MHNDEILRRGWNGRIYGAHDPPGIESAGCIDIAHDGKPLASNNALDQQGVVGVARPFRCVAVRLDPMRFKPSRPVSPVAVLEKRITEAIGRIGDGTIDQERWAGDGQEHGREENGGAEAGIVAGAVPDRHIHCAARDVGKLRGRFDPHFDFRMPRGETAEAGGEPTCGQGGCRADDEGLRSWLPIPEELHGIVNLLETRRDLAKQAQARRRQLHLSVSALKKLDAKAFFERLDLLAHGPGRHVQFLRSALDAALPANFDERAQRAEGNEGRHCGKFS